MRHMQSPGIPEIEAALERVLKSPSFQSAGRLRRFLQYIVSKTLAGREDEIKEYSIGVDVYCRGPGFDPKLDCIVRVDAITLRRRLAHYYRNEGVDDTLVISIPRGRYVPKVEVRSASMPVFDMEVDEACWRARSLLSTPTPMTVRLAQQQFASIIRNYPSSGIAYAGFAEAVLAALGIQELAPVEGNGLVTTAALRALELDNDRVDVQIYSAVPGICDPSDRGTKSALRRILQIDPGHAVAHHWAAGFCSSNGYHEEAVTHMKKAIHAQPSSCFFRTWMAGALFYAGKLEDARRYILEAVELAPDNFLARFWVAQILTEQAVYPEALKEATMAVNLCSATSLALWGLGWVQARAGLRDEAESTLERLKEQAAIQYVPHSGLAGILSGLGRLPEAWDELVKAKQARESIMGWSRFDPRWEPLRRVMPCL